MIHKFRTFESADRKTNQNDLDHIKDIFEEISDEFICDISYTMDHYKYFVCIKDIHQTSLSTYIDLATSYQLVIKKTIDMMGLTLPDRVQLTGVNSFLEMSKHSIHIQGIIKNSKFAKNHGYSPNNRDDRYMDPLDESILHLLNPNKLGYYFIKAISITFIA